MATKNPTDQGAAEPPSPELQDLRDQAVVLAQVLSHWPIHLRLSDLVREIAENPGDFAERDRIERATRDLIGAGLLFRCEALVLPTRAALHFKRLEDQ